MDHLKPEHVALLTELARCQIAAHEALRAVAEPRTEAAATFAAQNERATQDMLRRALTLGDRTPVADPLREMARRLGVALDESIADWRTLAFEALRVMLDVSREREKREVGTYDEVTPIFRSVMASRAASPAVTPPVVTAQSYSPALAVPAATAKAVRPVAVPTMPAATTPQTATEAAAPVQALVTSPAPSVARAVGQTSDYLGYDLVMADHLPTPAFCWPTVSMTLTACENPWTDTMSCPSSPCANHERSELPWNGSCIVFATSSNGASTSSRAPAASPPVTTRLRSASWI